MGLSITRHFVELLGGTIQLDSALGRGSRFYVEIPGTIGRSERSNKSRRRSPASSDQPGTGTTRLSHPDVEDQPENRQLLARLVRAVGFDVEVSEDGARAVDTFAAWRPDFIWMDVGLPVLSGLEAAKRIRSMEGGRAVKIAAVTASAFNKNAMRCSRRALTIFCENLFTAGEIFDCMARHIGVRYVYAADQEPASPTRARSGKHLEDALLSLDHDHSGRGPCFRARSPGRKRAAVAC